MSKGTIFWVIMILAILGWGWGRPWVGDRFAFGGGLALYICLFLLGWQVFGFVIH
jgi:hypothetical protein